MTSINDPLRVLVAHPSADLYGSDRVLLETVQALLERGDRVAVALPGPGPLVAELQGRGALVEYCPTPVLRRSLLSPAGLLRLSGESLRGFRAGLQVLRRYRPDALYVNTVTVPLWPLLGRLARVPTVTHVHEAERHTSRKQQLALALPLLLANSIVANSRFTADTLGHVLPALRGRARVVYNGVPGPASPPPARPALDGRLRVAYVGRLSHRKGVDVALDAVAQLRRRGVDASLDIVGAAVPGYEDYEQLLRHRVQKLGLGQDVVFHGFQPYPWDILAGADAAVVPSRLDESFGNTAVEAVLASRPLVASSVPGLREAAEGYASAQFAAPGDAAGMADALERIVTDWDRYRAAAALDAAAAVERHAPRRYRHSIAAAVAEAAGPRG
ncbi:glycosyltransferase [Arthrobacter sp. I2-34]|uniref:Glycosyltransferase n=1 Tax=Arthrobacter hankyongi TaxID=2904801 RepID=A0ABS9L1U1_9MICC|nr:glycosyltransferase [Arthrobacter hankyongi]MCG2620538.1 glycosyltransferase [Arthrobacter hankyongi]